MLRHNGTRVLPIFILSLMHAPEDVVLSTRDLMVASHDAIIVLQLRGGEKWGMAEEFYTGHVVNGKRVVTDGRDSTRHVIACLAQALAGAAMRVACCDSFCRWLVAMVFGRVVCGTDGIIPSDGA